MKNLKKARENIGLTQKELAKKIFVTSKTIFNYENGEREPDLKTLIQLSKVLNVPIDYLIGIKDTLFLEDVKSKITMMEKEELVELLNKIIDIVELISKK